MTLYDWMTAGGGLTILFMCLVQISPIKIDPWTALGNAFNKGLYQRMDKLDAKIDKVAADMDEQAALNYRTRILRFGDELLRGVDHTKEHFDQTLNDVTLYEQYCMAHPTFKNNMTVLTTLRIKEVYKKCMEQNSFL